MKFSVVVPGEPVAQGRPRARAFGVGHAVLYDPAKSRNWKRHAAKAYADELKRLGLPQPLFPSGPLLATVTAVFACPKSHYLKRNPRPRRPKESKPDCENISKGALDAGNSLIYFDDSQVVREVVEKWIGEQGEEPYVLVEVEEFQVERFQW